MIVCRLTYCNNVAIVTLQKSGILRPLGHSVPEVFKKIARNFGRSAVIDASGVKHLSYSEIGVLIDAIMQFQTGLPSQVVVAVAGMGKANTKRLLGLGLDRYLNIFKTVEDALCSDELQALQLCGHRAVLLCGESGSQMAPINREKPTPMLDFLGVPILERAANQLASFGVKEFLCNPGQLGAQIPKHFRNRNDLSFFYKKELALTDHDNSIDTLARLHHDHCAFEHDTFVQMGTTVSNLDFAALMRKHKQNQADVSYVLSPDQKSACLMIMKPSAFDVFSNAQKSDFGKSDLFTFLRMSGLRMAEIRDGSTVWEIQNGCTYFKALRHALSASNFGHDPVGNEIEPGIWAEQTAHIENNVRVKGQCYFGKGAIISPEVEITGTCIVGENCSVNPRSYLRDSLLTNKTKLKTGAILDNMIVGTDWAVNHVYADGSPQNTAPLDCVFSTAPMFQPAQKRFEKIG